MKNIFLVSGLAPCLACNEAVLQQTSDASMDACVAHTVVFCDAAAIDASGCVGDPGDASQLSADASFPVGCMANVLGSTRDPITGVCSLAASCTCEGDDASAAHWACSP